MTPSTVPVRRPARPGRGGTPPRAVHLIDPIPNRTTASAFAPSSPAKDRKKRSIGGRCPLGADGSLLVRRHAALRRAGRTSRHAAGPKIRLAGSVAPTPPSR
jgi:hypothetical protein